jgi:hypothetical protein
MYLSGPQRRKSEAKPHCGVRLRTAFVVNAF